MLRAALLRNRPLEAVGTRFVSFSQVPRHSSRSISSTQSRWFAEPDKIVFPGSNSQENTRSPPIPTTSTSPVKPASATIPPENVPKTPVPNTQQKSPPTVVSPSTIPPTGTGTASTSQSTTPPPPPPPRPKKKRRIRRFFVLLLTATGLFYAGGTYYSLHNDAFHDFFTEYVPLGDEAVLFFEEREFKRRFPSGSSESSSGLYPQTSGENKVTFAGKSGLSARPAGENQKSSSQTSSSTSSQNVVQKTSDKLENAVKTEKDSTNAKSIEKDPARKSNSKKGDKVAAKKDTTSATGSDKSSTPTTAAKSSISAAPIPLIDTLSVENAEDPIVQEVVKMLNDLITVVNADNTSGKYSSSMEKAKDDLTKIAKDMATLRATQTKAADERIRELEEQFDHGAKQLISRVQQEQQEQELQWREEYEAERERLSQAYQEKLKSEIEAAQKFADQRLQNELLEQDIKLNNDFAASVRSRVETERDGRLSKLNDLASAVSELDSLTAKWNEVVDSNLKTQHLVVAVDAVRAILENADRPTPFLRELAALKEIANDNSVVNAAISSIHPTAYQRGTPTSAQLVDRFRRVAAEVRKAALLPEDAGVASHVASFILSKVMFKKSGLAPGDDVESILSRTETLLEEGQLDEATREMNGLAGWAKVLSKDWLADCRRVLEVRQAMEVIATEARLQSLLVD